MGKTNHAKAMPPDDLQQAIVCLVSVRDHLWDHASKFECAIDKLDAPGSLTGAQGFVMLHRSEISLHEALIEISSLLDDIGGA